MSLSKLLAEVKGRLEAATPGPWKVIPASSFHGFDCVEITPGNKDSDMDIYMPRKNLNKDAPLIASAPTDLAKLIKIVEVLSEACSDIDSLKLIKAPNKTKSDKNGWIIAMRITANEALAKADEIAKTEK